MKTFSSQYNPIRLWFVTFTCKLPHGALVVTLESYMLRRLINFRLVIIIIIIILLLLLLLFLVSRLPMLRNLVTGQDRVSGVQSHESSQGISDPYFGSEQAMGQGKYPITHTGPPELWPITYCLRPMTLYSYYCTQTLKLLNPMSVKIGKVNCGATFTHLSIDEVVALVTWTLETTVCICALMTGIYLTFIDIYKHRVMQTIRLQ